MKSLISRSAETKYVAETIAADNVGTAWNSIISTQNDWYRAVPLVQQGTQQNRRIGDEIQPTKLRLNFSVHFFNSEASTRDITVVIYLLTSKKNKSYETASASGALPAMFQQYLDKGDGSATYFNGNYESSTYPVNHTLFNSIKKFEIPLIKGSGVSNGAGIWSSGRGDLSGTDFDMSGNVVASDVGMATHERSVRVNKSYTFKKIPELKYGDASNTYPTNFAPVWAAGYYYNDGTSPDTVSNGILRVSCVSHLWYKDS